MSLVAAALHAAELPSVPWPEQVGAADPAAVVRELAALDESIDAAPQSESALGARYRRALLLLEPTAAHDAAGATADLLALATRARPPWEARARHALAWLREHGGELERAGEGYRRVLADHPGSDAAARSKAALGRLALLAGRAAEAAALLDEALAEGVPAGTGADAAREAAVRVLLRPNAPLGGAARAHAVELQDVDGVAAGRGGLYLVDRRAGRMLQAGYDGAVLDRWSWSEPIDGVAAGRELAVAAVAGVLWRLEPEGSSSEFGRLGDFDPPGALALGAGGAWVVDRRGQRLGRIGPGETQPTTLADDRERRIVALAWDGGRLLGLDGRDGTVRVLWSAAEGVVSRAISVSGVARPAGLAVDPAGGWLVLDSRSGARLFDREGGLVSELPGEALGVVRPAGAVFAPDGALHVVDGRGPAWRSWP